MRNQTLCSLMFGVSVLFGMGCQRQVAQAASSAAPGGNAPVPTAAAPFATPPVLPGTPDIATLAARVKPSVVNITTVHEVKAPDMGFGSPFGFDPFDMFPGFGRRGQGGGDQVFRQQALGSGFVVDALGHVVTNAHVVENANEVKVRLADDREFVAKVQGRDARLDIAVLKLEGASDVPFAALGSSADLRVGEYVVAIGNPFGLGNTVTMGIVSAKSRAIGAGPYDDFIQTDASINPGNSGGPLFNLRGQVVGINTAINPNGKGIGFAIPVDELRNVLPQLLGSGRVARGRLGLLFQQVTAPLAKALGFDRPKGALVGEVEPGGPADKAGIRAGDLIVRVDQTEIAHAEELPRLVARNAPGTRVKVDVVRERASRTFEVTLDELKDDVEPGSESQAAPGSKSQSDLGIALTEVPGQGVVVQRVQRGGPADGEIAPGDVVLEINQKPVARVADAARLLAATPAGRPVLLKIKHGGQTRFVAIERR
jgi:serine protease Do